MNIYTKANTRQRRYTSYGKKLMFPVPKSTNNWSFISWHLIKQSRPPGPVMWHTDAWLWIQVLKKISKQWLLHPYTYLFTLHKHSDESIYIQNKAHINVRKINFSSCSTCKGLRERFSSLWDSSWAEPFILLLKTRWFSLLRVDVSHF